jgi:hypothetical protein
LTISGNNEVNGYSNYAFTFKVGTRNVKTTDYLGFALPKGFINTINLGVTSPTCASGFCSEIYIFHASSMIYVKPASLLVAGSTVSFSILGVSNPNYA